MIYKRMNGRLGNQLFQYATIRAFQLKYRPNEEIILDFKDVYKLGNKEDGFCNSLKNFNLPEDIKYIDNYKMELFPWLLFLFYKFMCLILKIFDFSKNYIYKRNKLELKIAPFYMKNGVYIYTDGFYEFKNCNKKNLYFFGYYESSKYFSDIKNVLRDELIPKIKITQFEILDEIEKQNSVCVSIRGGDFLSDKFIKDYYVCTPEYYCKAIKILNSTLKNPVFYIFSDDIPWVKKNIDFGNIKVIYEMEGYNLFDKLSLMSSCKHFILSNSSFSFWAQFLCNNLQKKVIAPNKWSNKIINPDIYENSWIKISVDKEEK